MFVITKALRFAPLSRATPIHTLQHIYARRRSAARLFHRSLLRLTQKVPQPIFQLFFAR